jgi:CBS domain-containing protein
MIICPYCDAETIKGVDNCEQCGQPLADLHLASPATLVEKALLRDRVAILKPRTPITVTPDTTVAEALKTLVEKSIGCLFVVAPDDPNRLVGVFTERDALLRLDPEADHSHRLVSEVMTPNPQGLPGTAKIAFAVRMMDLGSYRHVPVIQDGGNFSGVVSVRDILNYLTNRMAQS